MSKPSKSGTTKRDSGKSPAKSPNFQDRNLVKVNPMKEQFEPTDSCPIRQRNKMGGGG